MLQFHREAVRTPHLVLVDGSRRDAGRSGTEHAGNRGARGLSAVAVVLIATVVAVVVDLVDSVPAWSPWAVLGSLVVLATHAAIRRTRLH